MAETTTSVTLSGSYNQSSPYVAFSTAQGDEGCQTFYIYNRDSTNFVSAYLGGVHLNSNSAASIPPGALVPFKAGESQITSVLLWGQSGTPIIDCYVSGR